MIPGALISLRRTRLVQWFSREGEFPLAAFWALIVPSAEVAAHINSTEILYQISRSDDSID